ncbi:DUF559 domain-containing protein [Demequina sediminicola]|uniref:DUF559 domain-containing protein n=1 Tax=Demequina sediminicola TaxID=1095026 RepID=UPI00078123D7|nr:DUF559 domain-containing protein [Demequina sediminicola]
MNHSRALAAIVDHLNAAHGPATRAELTTLISERSLQRAVDAGVIVRVVPGIYDLPGRQREPLRRVMAVAAWMPPKAVLTGAAAAVRWGHKAIRLTSIDVLMPPEHHSAVPAGVRPWRSKARIPVMVIEGVRTAMVEHIPVQRWIREVDQRTPGALLDSVRDLQCNPRHVLATIDRYPRVPDSRRLREVLNVAQLGITSALEYRAKTEVFNGPEWDPWEWQGRVRTRSRTCIVDMLHRQARIAVEFDGAKYHSDDAARRRDIERDALLSAAGYLTLRFTYEDIAQRPQWCIDRVREVLALRLSAASSANTAGTPRLAEPD